MALQEQAYRFITCPEDAVPEASEGSKGGGGVYFEAECSLCIPTASRHKHIGGGHHQPPMAASSGTSGYVSDSGDRAQSTSSAGDDLGGSGACRAWRVLPSRAALSLRLERLVPSRPPRPSRAPPVAPIDSVCRLRFALRAVRASIRAAHPGSLGYRESLSESWAVMVGWNGYDSGVGPSLEWLVQVPSGNSAQSSGLSTDLLLQVPRLGRSGLVLTFRVVAAPSLEMDGRASEGFAAAAAASSVATLGRVSIDWDGLSCLPVSRTDYFVDTPTTPSPVQPACVDLELLASASSPSSSVATASAHGSERILCDESTTSSIQRSASDEGCVPREARSCGRTAGLYLRASLQLETSQVSVPHVLSLLPVAARGPTMTYKASHSADSTQAAGRSCRDSPKARLFSVGDFRDPCRRQRVPYLRFSWPWDDFWSASIERRNSLIPRKPWQMGSRNAVAWTRKCVANSGGITTNQGEVSGRLPLTLSGLDGSVAWPGSQELRTSNIEDCSKDTVKSRREKEDQPTPHVVFVEAFDMGPYARLEHRAAATVQRAWRRALDALRSAREWWEYYATLDRNNAAVCVQAHYRGWRGRQVFLVAKQEAAVRDAAAATLQRPWR